MTASHRSVNVVDVESCPVLLRIVCFSNGNHVPYVYVFVAVRMRRYYALLYSGIFSIQWKLAASFRVRKFLQVFVVRNVCLLQNGSMHNQLNQ